MQISAETVITPAGTPPSVNLGTTADGSVLAIAVGSLRVRIDLTPAEAQQMGVVLIGGAAVVLERAGGARRAAVVGIDGLPLAGGADGGAS